MGDRVKGIRVRSGIWLSGKKSPFAFLVLSFILLMAAQAEARERLQFHLPVHLLKHAAQASDIKKEDFTLLVNNRSSEIALLHKKQRCLLLQSDLGRTFVLSFRLADYGPLIERELSYFVSEILNTSDRLFLLTPLRMYRLPVSPRKERIQEEIRHLLENDLAICSKDRAAAERRLMGYIDQLKRAFGADVDGAEAGKKTALFLDTFPGELLRFQERYLLPDPPGIGLLLEHIGPGEGERWWIHFEQHQNSGLFGQIQDVVTDIHNHISSLEAEYQELAQVMRTRLAEIEQCPSLPDSTTSAALAEAFLGHAVNYNVIFFRNLGEGESEFARTPFPHLESLLGGAARASGGIAVVPGSEELGMKAIASHNDEYYELVFDWDGVVERKDIKVLGRKQGEALSYASNFTPSQIQTLAQSLSREKIRIGGIEVTGKRLSFFIQTFALEGEGQYGLIKVRVQLLDERSRNIFNQAHTLRATKEKVLISLPLPRVSKGKCRLLITACDMIANQLATDELQIELER